MFPRHEGSGSQQSACLFCHACPSVVALTLTCLNSRNGELRNDKPIVDLVVLQRVKRKGRAKILLPVPKKPETWIDKLGPALPS